MRIKETYKEICPICHKQVYASPYKVEILPKEKILIEKFRCKNPQCYAIFDVDNFIIDKFGNLERPPNPNVV